MTRQTFTLCHRFMRTALARFPLPVVMTIKAELRRRLRQHAGILAGMLGMTGLAIPFLDGCMLRSAGHIIVTAQAEFSCGRFQTDFAPSELMAIIAVAATHRIVDHLSQQAGVR